jgi:hypothetical protein
MANPMHNPKFFSRLHVARKQHKHFLCYKKCKNSRIFWMKKPNVNHGYKEEAKSWMKKPKSYENRIKIGENFILRS